MLTYLISIGRGGGSAIAQLKEVGGMMKALQRHNKSLPFRKKGKKKKSQLDGANQNF